MHAVGRLALHPWVPNVQVSWVKAGPQGAVEALRAGANDLGGTLMNESISRSAGAAWGQELPPERMESLIRSAGRIPRQRTTLYGDPPPEQVARSFGAPPLAEPWNPHVNEARLARPAALVRAAG
jgi:FO synthase